MVTILTALFGLAIAASPGPAVTLVSPDAWMPQAGDRMVVDVETNVGYLIREDGEYTSFPVMTGQQRMVHYLGRTYFAATPQKRWTAMEKNTQGDRVTFGPTGAFLRLYDHGEPTNYGIHGTKYFDNMLAEGNQYRSMGCVLVDEEILALVIETFELNRNSLDLVTTRDVRMGV